MPTITSIPQADIDARLGAAKLLVDLDPDDVQQEIAELRDQAGQDQLVVAADYSGCGVLETYATPHADEIVVEFFFDENVQCVRAVEFTALYAVDIAGTNSKGDWDYRNGVGLRTVTIGLQARPTPAPAPPDSSPTPTVERVQAPPTSQGVEPEMVLTDPTADDSSDALSALSAANSSEDHIVAAEFQGCVLLEVRAIPMPTEVVVRAAFDPDVDCVRAFEYQAFFVIEATGTNDDGSWDYPEPPAVRVEPVDG